MISVLDLGGVATVQFDYFTQVVGDIYDVTAKFPLFAADRANVDKGISFRELLNLHKSSSQHRHDDSLYYSRCRPLGDRFEIKASRPQRATGWNVPAGRNHNVSSPLTVAACSVAGPLVWRQNRLKSHPCVEWKLY